MNRRPRQSRNQRAEIATTAARMIVDGTAADFEAAKRKAARELGLDGARNLPDNLEVHHAVGDYLSLFHGESHRERVTRLREAALRAMGFFAPFDPRLTGAVLYGTASDFTPITLHLVSDESEAVLRFLLDRGCRYEETEARLRFPGVPGTHRIPVYRVRLYGENFELAVFPVGGATHHPVSLIDGRPARRLGVRALSALLESGRIVLREDTVEP